MADNVAVTAGTGTTIAADEVSDGTLGTVKVQYVKIMDGTIDGTAKATVNSTGLKVDASGASVPVIDSITAKTPLYITAAYSASQTAATVLTPTSGKKFVITDIVVSSSGAGTVKLFDGSDTGATGIGPILSLGANGGWDHTFAKQPYASAAVNNVLKYTSGSGAAGSIWIEYYEA